MTERLEMGKEALRWAYERDPDEQISFVRRARGLRYECRRKCRSTTPHSKRGDVARLVTRRLAASVCAKRPSQWNYLRPRFKLAANLPI